MSGERGEQRAETRMHGRPGEIRSVTKDATATAVEQAPLSGIPTATPAQVTNKRHKSTASTSDIDPS